MTAVRAATVEDASAIAAVHVSSWRIAYRGVFPDAAIVADTERRREAWRRYIEQPVKPEQRLLVATSSGEVVGFAAFGPSRDDDVGEDAVGEVYATYVEPRLWRQGVGQALLAEAERLLRASSSSLSPKPLSCYVRSRAFSGAQRR